MIQTYSPNRKRKSRALPENKLNISFEFFPPKSSTAETVLWNSIQRLAPLHPDFVSVTYGAGGTTRDRTHAVLARLLRETSLAPAAHLTCVAATREEINDVIKSYRDIGVRHIVALRGDSPEGPGHRYEPHPGGYARAADLIAGIKAIDDFEISVGGYPEGHPESPSPEADIDWLKQKVDAGADRIITQFFFDNAMFMNYLDRVRSAGITVPVVPGIIPIANFTQVTRFAKMTGASVPDWLAHRFEGLEDDPETNRLVAAAVAAEQVMELVDNGITDFHFYTMNRANLVYAICHMLGMRPHPAEQHQEAAQ